MNETKKDVKYTNREETQKLNNFIYSFRELQKIAKALQRSHENDCNYGLTPRQETRERNLMKKAQEIAERLGFNAYEQGDPRGCSLYLVTPEMKTKYDTEYTQGIAVY